MDFFDGWCAFKTTPEGKTIYYPDGFFWGKGFVLPNLKKKKGIQKAAERLYIILLSLYAAYIVGTWICVRLVPFGWQWYVGIVVIVLMLGTGVRFQRSMKTLADGLPESEIRISLQEGYSMTARSLGFTFLLFSEIVSVWAVNAGSEMINRDLGFWFVKTFGIGAVIFGILLYIITTHIIILKIKSMLQNKTSTDE